MNYEAQLFSQHHHSRSVTERHSNTAATRPESLQFRETMQKVQAHDDETLGSGSSVAGTHALDNNETDTDLDDDEADTDLDTDETDI